MEDDAGARAIGELVLMIGGVVGQLIETEESLLIGIRRDLVEEEDAFADHRDDRVGGLDELRELGDEHAVAK